MAEQFSNEGKTVLITGTRGRVGNVIVPRLSRLFNVFEFDKEFTDSSNERQIPGDVAEFDVVAAAVENVRPDCIIHMAANANEHATAEEVDGPNRVGTHNILEAAVEHGVLRVVLASSVFTYSGYPGFAYKSPFEDGRKIRPDDLPKPSNPYGESKVAGERLAKEYSEAYGLRTISLRLGGVNPENVPSSDPTLAPAWLSHDDVSNLFERAVLAEPPKLASVYFATSHKESPYDMRPTIEDLGFHPASKIF